MCGLVGVVTPNKGGFNRDQVDVLRDLLFMTSLRGVDATGVFYVTNNGDVQVHKEASPSWKFLETEAWKSTERELFASGHAAVGHCRAATRGGKTDANAHPFRHEHIVLVHNGTLTNSYELAKTDVDSEAIAHKLAEVDDISAALKEIKGAYSLIWYNLKTNKLHAIHNDERPLAMCQAKDGSIYLASEVYFLSAALSRHQVKYDTKVWPYYVASGSLITIDLETHGDTFEEETIDIKPETKFFPAIPMGTHVSHGEHIYISALQAAENLKIARYELPMRTGEFGAYRDHNYRDFLKQNDELVIEACEYHPVDLKDKQNTNYYIFGKVMSTDDRVDGLYVYWEINFTGPDEQDIMDYVSGTFFQGKIEYILSRPESISPAHITLLSKVRDVRPLERATLEQMQ